MSLKWAAGKKISNREVRKLLAAHPFGEPEVRTKELYGSFSKAAHPNRDLVAHRFLGEGNEFVLGSSGKTDLVLLVDYCGKTLNLWFWYVAFIGFIYAEVLVKHDKIFSADYLKTAQTAKEVNRWLHKQYNRVLADYPVEHEENGFNS